LLWNHFTNYPQTGVVSVIAFHERVGPRTRTRQKQMFLADQNSLKPVVQTKNLLASVRPGFWRRLAQPTSRCPPQCLARRQSPPRSAPDAAESSGVECRFHDLRHTGCTRLLETGVSHPIVAELMGWSASTAIRMIKEVYGHIGLAARRHAMEQLDQFAISAENPSEGAQKGAQSEQEKNERIQ
jgi:hypothetical protein